MKTILIVDDEPNIVMSLEYLLQRAGYRVLVAHDAEDALQCVARESPDLMLLDLMLPRMTGYEVCEKVRADARHAGMKILMLTARGREVERTKGLALGADGYVTKPFSTADLLEQLRAQLGEA